MVRVVEQVVVKEMLNIQARLDAVREFTQGFLKIFLSFYQVMASLPRILPDVDWPPVLIKFAPLVGAVFNIDLQGLPGLGCVVPSTFNGKLLAYLLAPAVVVAGILGTERLSMRLYEASDPRLLHLRDRVQTYVNIFLFIARLRGLTDPDARLKSPPRLALNGLYQCG